MSEEEVVCNRDPIVAYKEQHDETTKKRLDLADLMAIDGRIFLGSFNQGVKSAHGLSKLGVTHILTVGNDMPPAFPKEFIYKVILIDDHPSEDISKYFEEGLAFVRTALKENHSNKVVINCFAGISRSATMTIFIMSRLYDLSYTNAFEMVRRSRWFISPNHGFQTQLVAYLASKYGVKETERHVEEYTKVASCLRKMYRSQTLSLETQEFIHRSFGKLFGADHLYTIDVIVETRAFIEA
jgi:protein-tyrosine phosphatase